VWFKRWDPFLNKKTTDPIILESEREREESEEEECFFLFFMWMKSNLLAVMDFKPLCTCKATQTLILIKELANIPNQK
jgi:hypothetical protein